MSSRTMVVFPGQGSQYPGMLEAVPETDAFDRLLDAAEALTDLELRTIAALSDETELSDTRVAQPLLYLADWAWGTALLDSGLVPDGVAGHSLGELAALAIAGVYSVEAGLELVVERSRLMATHAAGHAGAMAAVIGLPADRVRECIDPFTGVWLANDNAPGQVVISGLAHELAEATDALRDAGARRVIPLKVSGAFHTPLMEPAAQAFAEIVRGADFADALYPVYQNVDPEPTRDAHTIRERLLAQMSSGVRWTETMQLMASGGPVRIIEAGPGSVLTGLARRIEGVDAVSAEAAGIEAAMSGGPVT